MMMNAVNNGSKYDCNSVVCHRPYKLSACWNFSCVDGSNFCARIVVTAAADSTGHRRQENTGHTCQIQLCQ